MRLLKLFKLVLLFFCFLSAKLEAQTQHEFRLYWAPTLSYRSVEKGSFPHQKAMRYDIGVNYLYSINDKLKIGSGLVFSRKGFDIDEVSVGMYDITSNSYKYYRDFVEIPLFAELKLKANDKYSLSFDMGLVNQLYIHESTEGNIYGNIDNSYSDLIDAKYKTYNLAPYLGFSYHRVFNEKLSLIIAPFFEYGLFSLNNIHDYSLGLKIGIGLR